MEGERFGITADGDAVQLFRIEGGGLKAAAMNWGAVLQDLRLSGHEEPLVLGFERFDDYPAHSPYMGAIAGRYANRIKGGRFIIGGRRHQADRNFLGKHTLHGGAHGFAKQLWQVALHGPDFVTFTLHSPDGDMGFPGALEATCTYRLKIPGTLSIELTAATEEPTLCNLAHHSYFNLDDGGSNNVLDHRLMLPAGAYLPVDDELIPTGVVEPVDGTVFDFRHARPIRMEVNGEQVAYDHNFCLAASRSTTLRQAAWAQGALWGVEMEVWTTEPGLQFYAGHKLAPKGRGLGGRHYTGYAGFALEPQVWPDSPNRPYFPQAALCPGTDYRQITEYRFRLG
ncbi:aldose epimerase family protein [Mesorhizobium sp. 1B3]|uniref:aldose epimerase family protein n=1 Tax=Mesorhizobium sp. 1B3 TaxID=3243599 RepID=UPI003D96CEAF